MLSSTLASASGGSTDLDNVLPHLENDINTTVNCLVAAQKSGVGRFIIPGARMVDWVFIDDVIDALVLAGAKPGLQGKALEIGSGVLVSINDVADKVRELIPGAPCAQTGAESFYGGVRAADLDAASRYIQWSPKVSLDEGLRATVQRYRRQASY